jgi:hypothetical protein
MPGNDDNVSLARGVMTMNSLNLFLSRDLKSGKQCVATSPIYAALNSLCTGKTLYRHSFTALDIPTANKSHILVQLRVKGYICHAVANYLEYIIA